MLKEWPIALFLGQEFLVYHATKATSIDIIKVCQLLIASGVHFEQMSGSQKYNPGMDLRL